MVSFAKSMVDEFQLPKAAFDLCGKWNAATTQGGLNHNASYHRYLEKLNEPYELFSAAQMQALTGSNLACANCMKRPQLFLLTRFLINGLRQQRMVLFERIKLFERLMD